MASVNITHYSLFSPNLTVQQIQIISGMLLDRTFLDIPIPVTRLADITFEEEFEQCKTPQNKIIKMSKTKYIDDFFDSGKLQIGTFKYFRQIENKEIGDRTEGSIVIVGINKSQTAIAEIGSGFDNYVFCCYEGVPNLEIIENFEYDDYFEIIDFEGFSNAIGSSLSAKKSYKSGCIYKQDKVLVGQIPQDFNFSIISARLKDLVNETKYFLKKDEYKHQKEFRFIWEVNKDVYEPLIIDCFEATKFCRRK